MATKTATTNTGSARTRKPAQTTASKGRATNRTRNTTETDPTPEVATPTGGICRCGCGGQTGGTYRQGHDAKHVSVLVSYVAAQTITYEDAKRELPSGALQVKFHNAWNKLVRKAEAKAQRDIAKAIEARSEKADEPSQGEN